MSDDPQLDSVALETITAKIESLRAAEKNSTEQLAALNHEETASQEQFRQIRNELVTGIVESKGAIKVLEGLLPTIDTGKGAAHA